MRKSIILQKKKDEIFEEFFSKLPKCVKKAICHKTLDEQKSIVLGFYDISLMSIIEYFRRDQIIKLTSKDVKMNDKFLILFWQLHYLKELGVKIPNEENLSSDFEGNIVDYLKFINKKSIRKYIPSDDLICDVSRIRKMKYEAALIEYYTTRSDFIAAKRIFDDNPISRKIIYDEFKNKKVCILGRGAIKNHSDLVSIMFYTIRENDGGFLFQTFLHENGHVIDQNKNGCGFECNYDLGSDGQKNPYDNEYRKYEKFNESLNDIFTLEALEFLQNQGIYLIESKEFTSLDKGNHNIAQITKDLLKPLIQKFRKQVIKAKINAKPEELIKYIGKANFEDLVDVVNKVDYLSTNGYVSKTNKFVDVDMYMEYLEQLERVKQIYDNIDDYWINNYGISATDGLENLNENKMVVTKKMIRRKNIKDKRRS